jgi:hypothetical protein
MKVFKRFLPLVVWAFGSLAGAALGTSRIVDFELRLPRFGNAPQIDGVLDNPLWQGAAILDGFTQYEPQEGASPSERTVGYIAYDENNIYFAFRCYDSDPKSIRAALTQRDQSRNDDTIRLYLDTFNDKKRAFVFEVNPRGIQNDGVFTEGRRSGGRGGGMGMGGGGGGGGFDMYDKNWDTYFLADARIDDEGYTVEIAIPFKSIRFPNSSEQVWGLQVQRTIRRKNEEIYWRPRSRNVNGFLVQEGTISFKGNIETGRNLEVMPVATASKADTDPFMPEAGINLKYGLTSNLTSDITYNPDFSQIESDIPQVDVNQRYALYFPEKRPFFLEGKDFYDTPFELVYTRKIVDPQWGIKISGKIGKTTLGFLSAMDENPSWISFPGVPEDAFSLDRNRGWTNVLRLRQDLRPESHVGLILTDREMGPNAGALFDNWNRVGGLDGSFKFADFYRFSFQIVGSKSRAGGTETDLVPAMNFNLSHQSRHLQATLEWVSLPPDFEAATGFFMRKDVQSLNARFGYSFLPMTSLLVSATPSVSYRRIYDFADTLTDDEVSFTLFLSGWRQSTVFVNVSTGLERYNGVYFRGTDAWLSFSSEPFGWLNVNLSAQLGDGIYYSSTPYLGWKSNYGLRLTLRPLTNLRLYASLMNNTFSKERGGELVYRINLLTARLTYQLSKPLTLRLVSDYNDYDKKFYLSGLFAYELRPGTVFYIGFEDNQAQDENGIFRGTGRYYFVKFSYWWRL